MMEDNSGNQLENIRRKIERFVVRNVFILGLILAAAVTFLAFKVDKQEESIVAMKNMQFKQLNSVVGLTDDNTPVDLPLRTIDSRNHEGLVLRALLNYWIVGRMEITNNLKSFKVESLDDLVESSDKLTTLRNEYFRLNLTKNEESFIDNIDELRKEEEKGLKYFYAYIQYIKDSLTALKLPYYFAIRGYEVDDFISDKNRFTINLKIKVNMKNWVGVDENNNDIWVLSKGTYEIKADGYFDIKTRTKSDKKFNTKGINKMGLHFTKVTFNPLEFRG
jgi:hypothetical protein